MKVRTLFPVVGLILISLILFGARPLPARALTSLPATVIDDFEDGDSGDWGFFGGNAAGGGGGVLSDRPAEGSFYLSTGWGGDGTASTFYGGFFRNLDNAAQVAPPADPWFNVWVLNQSDATVDQYTLEITLREDLNGDGWTDGSEDSFRLDTTFTNASFNDQWTLLSAPVSSFVNLGTGGDGQFNGNLDEIVVVVAGVVGGSGSVVELDLDQFAFTSGGPLVNSLTVFDDMEHGDPFGNGWFAFGGAVGGGGIGPNTVDLPPVDGGVFSLETGWGSGGTPGFYGGFGRTFPLDLTATDHFNFWINPDAGQDYTLEINLQDDDNSDGAANAADDDEFQYNCVVSPAGPCAISGGGWQQIAIPLADFFDDNSFFTGGNGVLDAVPATSGGNGQLINVVIAVIGNSGSDATFRTDYWAFSDGPLATPTLVVDDFENGLPSGTDGDGNPIGFFTFSDGSPIGIALTDAPPAPVPGSNSGNNVLAMTGNVTSFAGFIHAFENPTVDSWVPQDWSAYQGLSFWLYGHNSGTTLFVDVIDNRNPGSTRDDAERFSVTLTDNFSGWQFFELPFSSFTRKEVGNGAPNDGFTLTQVHGWALGTLNTPGEITYYVDDAALYGVAEIPELAVTFAAAEYEIEEGTNGQITVKLNRPLNNDDPAQVSIDYYTEPGTATPGLEYTPVSGTLTFVNGGPSELTFALETFDDSKWEGTERVILRLTNPIDIGAGFALQAAAAIIDNDAYDSNLIDDFERGTALLTPGDITVLETMVLNAGAALAIPGQDAVETVLRIAPAAGEAPREVLLSSRDAVASLLPTGNSYADRKLNDALDRLDSLLLDSNWNNDYYFSPGAGKQAMHDLTWAFIKLVQASDKAPQIEAVVYDILVDIFVAGRDLAHLSLDLAVASDGNSEKIGYAEAALAEAEAYLAEEQYYQALMQYRVVVDQAQKAVTGIPLAPLGYTHEFPLGQDWSHGEALTFWYYGQNSGDTVTVQLLDNRAPDPGPAGWSLAWSDEFDEPAGTPPNPANWSFEIGDGTVNGIPGWGNDELQYYTDDPANAATDGLGNLAITVQEADGSLPCYYGACEYTSARLLSWHKAEFAYGRIEARIQVPDGPAGLWPAFWSLGNDIDVVPWPQTGEIDFMEYVSRLPNEIFGTIHGPGYSGGQSYGNAYDFGGPVAGAFHTYTIEWEPDLIKWYVDGILYHTASPADVAPNEWVFNDPIFILLNVAIGGNFGGAPDPALQMPQSMLVDYVRVYQGPDTAERFETAFVDNFAGWQLVEVPFTALTRSAAQPAGAPDDGLTLTDVWGYSIAIPADGAGTALLDQVRVRPVPPPTQVTVTTTADAGPGSLREALALIAPSGTIDFDPALAGQTIALTAAQLVIDRAVTIDGSTAPDLTVSGSNAVRVLQINGGVAATINDLTIADGAGAPQGGGILNFGELTLVRVTVRDNTESSTGAAAFDLGGGGIYNGDGAVLNLMDSMVLNNRTLSQPGGGLYGFFNSTLNISGSTINGNVAGDVAGGLRLLGNATIVNSTISGNVSTAWHGGAMFVTDGVVSILNSTIAANSAPAGTAGGIFLGTFTAAPVTMTLQNSIVANNSEVNCFQGFFGAGGVTLTSLGNNLFGDGSCAPIGTDVIAADAGLAALADNGGPTLTHALLPGSPAIDAANTAACPAVDQRGVSRDTACDIGAFEYLP